PAPPARRPAPAAKPRPAEPRPAPPPATPPPPVPSRDVLSVPEVIYVEDDAALAELLEYGLRAHGYRFLAYRNGRDALRELLVVAAAQGLLLFALIVLIILNRWVRLHRRGRVHPRRLELDAVMQRWALGQARPDEVLRALARLPVPLAIDGLVTWSARVAGE